MADIKIENVVASTQIAKSLDLAKLAEIIPNSRYNMQTNMLKVNYKRNRISVV